MELIFLAEIHNLVYINIKIISEGSQVTASNAVL